MTDYPEIFNRVAPKIKPTAVILDIGAGIRPQKFFKPKTHFCAEPHPEYAKWLKEQGYLVRQCTALEILEEIYHVDTIFMLDVIEHMEKADGVLARDISKRKASQVVVYTPNGFKEQSYKPGEKDAWGMNGTYWQTHRSGWTPEDFDGWDITAEQGSFFALFTA